MSETRNRYFEGYSEARDRVSRYGLPELIGLLDALFGRENLKYGADLEEVRAEALRQLEREFTNPEWEREWGPYIRATARSVR